LHAGPPSRRCGPLPRILGHSALSAEMEIGPCALPLLGWNGAVRFLPASARMFAISKPRTGADYTT